MSGTALDHRLVRAYLRELDAALRGLPAARARELKEQITAHLQDALGPDAGDQEVTATLRRLGSPAGLAAEAGAASGPYGPRSALRNPRMRWRLAAVIAVITVPVVIAAAFGALQISSDVSNVAAAGRVQQLVQLNAAVVTLTQDLEDERDLSVGYAAGRQAGPVPVTLAGARRATDAAASTVRADAAGVGAGYPPAAAAHALHNLHTLTTLVALLGVESEMSVQRYVLFAALSSPARTFAPGQLAILAQARQSQVVDQRDFYASAHETEEKYFDNTVSGPQVDAANSQESRAEAFVSAGPSATQAAGRHARNHHPLTAGTLVRRRPGVRSGRRRS